jgi:hypothetical protein
MSHKFYITDWIPEVGRYAIITTALQVEDTRNLAAETFVFGLDGEPFFAGKRLQYGFNPTTEKWCPVDEAYMHKEALGQAGCIIGLKKAEAYRNTKDSDIYRVERKPLECEAQFVFLGALQEKYETKLKELSEVSWAEDLKKVISAFLSVVIKVESV